MVNFGKESPSRRGSRFTRVAKAWTFGAADRQGFPGTRGFKGERSSQSHLGGEVNLGFVDVDSWMSVLRVENYYFIH